MPILTVKCNICNKVLVIVQKPEFSDDDQALYEQSCSCDTIQNDGITLDAQTSIVTAITQE